MPIGSLNRDSSAPKRETFRPPWVKDNTADAPPAWMQKKLKPVESTTKTMNVGSDESATVGKPTLRPALKKQSTIKDKTENGISEKIIMPSERLAKQRSQEKVKPNDKENKPAEKISKPAEKVLKPVEKVSKPVEKGKETQIVAKPVEKVTKFETKPVEKVDKAAEPVTKQIDKVNKPAETKPTEKLNRPLNNRFRKPTENVTKPEEKDAKPVTVTDNKAADRKTKSPEKVVKPAEKQKLTVNATDKKKVEVKGKEDPKVEEKSKAMATKPPLEKSASKNLPPRKPSIQKQPSRDDMPVKKWRDPLHERVKENIDKTLNNEVPKGHTLTKNESLRSLLKPTPPPMPPPMPPKAPPPPDFKKAQITAEKLKKIEQLKSRPRKRPDWSDMMKEVESGKKLKKVVCNDRSSPVITRAMVVKTKGEFIFESEKESKHNDLLKEINKGVKLKKVKTNDRSKPILEGLRKFRRQMTIEEQLHKSMSQANLAGAPPGKAADGATGAEIGEVPPEEEEIDEMDDIDKVRDDLQSTKQLLAIELRNKEAQERENKRLLNKIQNLEAELARERAIILQEQQKTVISVTDAYDERLVVSLKCEVDRAKATADDLEKRYLQAAEERDDAQTELEEVKRKNAELEKKLQQAMSQVTQEQEVEPMSYYVKRQLDFKKQCELLNMPADDTAQPQHASLNNRYDDDDYDDETGIVPSNVNSRRSSHAIKQMSIQRDSSFEEEEEESSEEEEESEEKKQKRMEKEVKNMRNKIRHLKEKQDRMKQERVAYKMSLKNQQAALKDAKKKYKELKQEVKKMAAMMKEDGSDDEEEDEESDEEEEEEKKDSESEESETETEAETESETESESEPEDAPLPKKKENLSSRLKRHESRVTALKKGNTLLMANVDRLKDDVNKQREESAALQKELDSLVEDFA